MKQINELTEKVKTELIQEGKLFDTDELHSFFEWMKVEYENYMTISREDALETLDRLESVYNGYKPLIEVLRNNIDEYGSFQSFYEVSIDLTSI